MISKSRHNRNDKKTPGQETVPKRIFLAGPEGRIFTAGLAIMLFYIISLLVICVVSSENFHAFLGLTATGILFGRAAAMSFGYAAGYGHVVVIPVCMLIETIIVLLFYPLFVFSWRQILVIKVLKKFMDRARKTAEAHRAKIRRLGVPGLFIFVFFPFWMTGPFMGSVVGFLIGFSWRVNVGVVLGATYLAIVGWALLLKEIHERVAAYSLYGPIIFVALLIAVVIGMYIFQSVNYKRKKHEK